LAQSSAKGATVAFSEIYILFGRRVAQARDSAGLTQSGLADKIGLSRASIANIEAGRQRIVLHQALEIADALSISSISELLPIDLVRPTIASDKNEKLNFSGSKLSSSEAETIQSIVASS
jgi:transcriptional regulator with XRE-family HTH domain